MEHDEFVSPFVLEYTYKRSTGPIIGRFLTSLRDGRLEGVRTPSGRVLFPPTEYDPETGASVGEWVGVGPEGTVDSWSWVAEPPADAPMSEPFAWALIRLDGADTAMLHVLRGDQASIKTGMRVRVVWREERVGHIRDILAFESAP